MPRTWPAIFAAEVVRCKEQLVRIRAVGIDEKEDVCLLEICLSPAYLASLADQATATKARAMEVLYSTGQYSANTVPYFWGLKVLL